MISRDIKYWLNTDVFDSWLNGQDIQQRDLDNNTWIDVAEPQWQKNAEYRVKPCEFKNGELVWVKDGKTLGWQVRFFSHEESGKHHCYNDQKKFGGTASWPHIRNFRDNPFLNKSEEE